MIPAIPVTFWQYFDAVVLVPFFVLMIWLLVSHYHKYGSFLSTVSHTIAASHLSSLVFSVSMTAIAPLYYAFVWFWAGPRMVVPDVFYWLLVPMLLSEILFVWLPANNVYAKWHTLFATLTMTGMVIETLLIVVFAQYLSVWARASFWLFLCCSFVFVIVFTRKQLQRFIFPLEVVYCLLFLLAISLAAHT